MKINAIYLRILLLIFCVATNTLLFSQSSAKEIKSLMQRNLKSIGITKDDVDNYVVNSNYKDENTGIEYVYIQQTFKGIKIFNMVISLAFKDDRLLYSSGKFLDPATDFKGNDTPLIEAGNAVLNAAHHLNLRPYSPFQTKRNNFKKDKKIIFLAEELSTKEIETELLWAQDDSGKIHLSWNVSIDVEKSNNWWNVRVDALTGEIVNKDNWTVHEKATASDEVPRNLQNLREHIDYKAAYKWSQLYGDQRNGRFPASVAPPNVQNASYLVVPFPFENTNEGGAAVENNPWLKAGLTNNAGTYGWHFDGFTNYSITRGNNVYAYEDSANTNSPGRAVTSSTAAPSVNFGVEPNFAIQPFDSANRDFGIVNLFYWNNIIHDVFYQYGFNENAGNFQSDNLGRGGSGNDYVRAEAQDGLGTDNANFSTPPDGGSGRMQMYLWSGPPIVEVHAPASVANRYLATESGFSLNNRLYKKGPVSAQVALYNDVTTPGTHDACDSSKFPTIAVNGRIVLINRGGCPFTTKMRSAQKAGAMGVIIVNNVPGAPIGLGGTDNQITIPGVMISKNDGDAIATELSNHVTMTITTGMLYDGDLDNGIITHEYGHGISNRLTGGRTNSSCLSNAEQGGEGWSDYMALMLTTNWQNAQATDGRKPRSVGTYVGNQPVTGNGIRRVRYSTDMQIDTLTYAGMDGNTLGNGEVHNIGEIWCSALWDMTWNIIQHEGSITPDLYNSNGSGGNVIALKLVIEGMKLQPCRPGFLDARNAILAADSILYNSRHKCDIWKAFARRGMGYSAGQGLSTSTADQVAAFDVPSGIDINRSAVPLLINSGTNVTYTTTLTCQCEVPVTPYLLTETIPPGFAFVNSSTGILNDTIIQFEPVNFSNTQEVITLTVTLKATATGCALSKPINDDRETNLIGGFNANRISGNTNWQISQTNSYSATRAWHAADVSSAANFTLTSGTYVPGNLSILSFWHLYETENHLDGGKVEISPDNGTTWIDAAPYFMQNGYNSLLNANAPEPNTFAFTGSSYSTGTSNNGRFTQSIINLSSFNNKQVKIRFRFQTNGFNEEFQTYDGWFVDDILLTNGCGGISQVALVNSNIKIDFISRSFFIVSNSVLPLTLNNFSAKLKGRTVMVDWATTNELNTTHFEVERSPDGSTWTKIGAVPAGELNNNAYNFNDPDPLENDNFYRVRVNDKDGSFAYTVTRKVEIINSGVFSIVPNPAINKATIYFGTNAKGAVITVSNLEGQILQKHVLTDNSSSYNLAVGLLRPGTYLIRAETKKGSFVKKLIVVK